MSLKLNVQFSNWTEKGTRDELQNKRKIGLSQLTPIFFRNKRPKRGSGGVEQYPFPPASR
jgi:hypothetical protein